MPILPDPLGLFKLDTAETDAARPVPAEPKPGCTAGDETLGVEGYLRKLGSGKKVNFGVLRQGKERLERAASACEQLGQAELAKNIRAVASDLPGVCDAPSAKAMADRLEPMTDACWDLGARCGKISSIGVQGVEAIIALAKQVEAGELSMESARRIVSEKE